MGLNLKKIRFLVLSVILILTSFFMALWIGRVGFEARGNATLIYLTLCGILTVLSSLFIQYIQGGERGLKFFVYLGLTPFLLNASCFLFFLSYPNLSLALKVLSLLFFLTLLYTLYLLNNVMLVVKSRESSIPVYRVAVNWVQIVLLSVAIPLFTSMFKVLDSPLLQILSIMVSSYVFYSYLVWVYAHDKEVRGLNTLQSAVLTGSFSVLVGWAVFSVLFVSTESFLRGLFISSVFLIGLGYIQLYLRNSLSKKNLWDYALICFTFGAIVILFMP